MSVQTYLADVDRLIANLLPEGGEVGAFYGMIRYHLGWVDQGLHPTAGNGGKRLRARLCLLSCQGMGVDPALAVAPAAAVELVHNFSLVHDDIQDGSEYRRHRRAAWAVWGAPQAINVGDGILTLAQLALLGEGEANPRCTLRALRALNEACRSLCEGQFLDLQFEQRSDVGVEEYHNMIERKTAALLKAACFLGALYGSAEESQLMAYSAFGRFLGLAFQIRDDYLGIWGDPDQTGKPVSADIACKKKTFPVLYALEKGTAQDRRELARLLSWKADLAADETSTVLGILNRSGAREKTVLEVEQATGAALKALDSACSAREASSELATLCPRLALRTH